MSYDSSDSYETFRYQAASRRRIYRAACKAVGINEWDEPSDAVAFAAALHAAAVDFYGEDVVREVLSDEYPDAYVPTLYSLRD